MTARTGSRVHPDYKTKRKTTNWAEYNEALRSRGDLAIWFSDEAIERWKAAPTGKRGAQRKYSDLAILTSLTLRLVFHLGLRQTQGFVRSLIRLMELGLDTPDFSTLSRRNRTVEVPKPTKVQSGPVHLIVDSSGLKILGDGEWHAYKHETKNRRRQWRKLHFGVDAEGHILATELTKSGADDAGQVPNLLDQIDDEIGRFTGDGAYDAMKVYEALSDHQERPIRVVVPPVKGAVKSDEPGRAVAWRNQNVEDIDRLGRQTWRKEAGYFAQGRAENTVFRYKRIIGDSMRAIDFEAQKRESQIGRNILNRMAELGMPASHPVAG